MVPLFELVRHIKHSLSLLFQLTEYEPTLKVLCTSGQSELVTSPEVEGGPGNIEARRMAQAHVDDLERSSLATKETGDNQFQDTAPVEIAAGIGTTKLLRPQSVLHTLSQRTIMYFVFLPFLSGQFNANNGCLGL